MKKVLQRDTVHIRYRVYYKGFFFLKSFMKKKVATKSRQTTSSISHVQHLLPRMLATWLG